MGNIGTPCCHCCGLLSAVIVSTAIAQQNPDSSARRSFVRRELEPMVTAADIADMDTKPFQFSKLASDHSAGHAAGSRPLSLPGARSSSSFDRILATGTRAFVSVDVSSVRGSGPVEWMASLIEPSEEPVEDAMSTVIAIDDDLNETNTSDAANALPIPMLGPAGGNASLCNSSEDACAAKEMEIVQSRHPDFSLRQKLTVGFGLLGVIVTGLVVAVIAYLAMGMLPPNATHPHTPPMLRIPPKIKIAYCLPTVATLPVVALIAVFLLAFYSQRGADLPSMALAVALARSFDVVSDPVMSHITDACRHALGRRKPFMICGAPMYGLFLVALFSPPFLDSIPLAAWFAITYIAFFLTNTICNIPYDAWGPELTDDPEERSRLFCLSGIFDGCGTLFAFAVPFAGFRMAKWFRLTSTICVQKSELVNLCSSGYHCHMYTRAGHGFEFVENTTFRHGHLTNYVDQLQNFNCETSGPYNLPGTPLQPGALSTFCECMTTCAQTCAVANRSYGFMITGLVFGLYYVVTSYYCCFAVRERLPPAGGRPKTPPLVPAVLRTLRNPAFNVLLPAWALDAASLAIFLTLCPYFVMYVIAPEYQTPEVSPFGLDCREGARAVASSAFYDRRCSSMSILGGCVFAALASAIISTPLWLKAVNRWGKVNMWLLWSFTSATTNFLFLGLGRNSIFECVVVCGLNGIPFAAKFLADSILADIIDYDEFLTGVRNEATYTMFKSFLPKVMAIPAAALPLAVINAMGHVPAENGKVMMQPPDVTRAITFMAGGVSGMCSILAWLIKRRFPLKSDDILRGISEGVALHIKGQPARDPLTGVKYALTAFAEEENSNGVWLLDHFSGTMVMETIVQDPMRALPELYTQAATEFHRSVVFGVFSVLGVLYSVPLLSNRVLSFIPTLAAVSMGVSLVLVGFTYFRQSAARELMRNPPDIKLLAKVLQQRRNMQELSIVRKKMARGWLDPSVGQALIAADSAETDAGTEHHDVADPKFSPTEEKLPDERVPPANPEAAPSSGEVPTESASDIREQAQTQAMADPPSSQHDGPEVTAQGGEPLAQEQEASIMS